MAVEGSISVAVEGSISVAVEEYKMPLKRCENCITVHRVRLSTEYSPSGFARSASTATRGAVLQTTVKTRSCQELRLCNSAIGLEKIRTTSSDFNSDDH